MWNLYKRLLILFNLPLFLSEFFKPDIGKEYGISFQAKIRLLLMFFRNAARIPTATGILEHVVMAVRLLSIPKSVLGVVVECGCFKGGSSANLSLICSLCNRRLHIFDSFSGLPDPDKYDTEHLLLDAGEIHTYKKGAWCGSLTEVKTNIEKYGDIEVCNFHPGYFTSTLPQFRKRSMFIFLDVDLVASLKTSLKYLWPLLQNGCYLFTHEAQHQEISSLFYDKNWWHKELGIPIPGLIGAGSGLGLTPTPYGYKSDLGYTIKRPGISSFIKKAQNWIPIGNSNIYGK